MDMPLTTGDRGSQTTESERWRPIHYLGSKLRILDNIREAVNDLSTERSPVCDLFAGSGTVSAALAQDRRVTSVDVQEYARVICSAILQPACFDVERFLARALDAKDVATRNGLLWAAEPLVQYETRCLEAAAIGNLEPLCELLEAGSLVTISNDRINSLSAELAKAIIQTNARLNSVDLNDTVQSVALRHFGGTYFSFRQAAELDILLNEIAQLPLHAQDIGKASVLSTASQIVNTIGKQFAQPLRPRNKNGTVKKTLHKLVSRDREKDTFLEFKKAIDKYMSIKRTAFEHKAIRADYRDFITKLEGFNGVVYADPPYTRDHYSRFYHVLETLALRDNPKVSVNKAHGRTMLSRGVYRLERHQSPFCIKSLAPDAFSDLFQALALNGNPLVLSYSPYAADKNAHPRVMKVEDIEPLARKFFSLVEIRVSENISHSRLNKTELNKEIAKNAEILFVCRP